jgi:hypothetical protein
MSDWIVLRAIIFTKQAFLLQIDPLGIFSEFSPFSFLFKDGLVKIGLEDI